MRYAVTRRSAARGCPSRGRPIATLRPRVRGELSAIVHGALSEVSEAVSAPVRTGVHGVARNQLPARLTEAWTLALTPAQAGSSEGSGRTSVPRAPCTDEARGTSARRSEMRNGSRQGSPIIKWPPEGITYSGTNSVESVGSVLDPTRPSQSQTEGNRKYPLTTTVGHPSPEDQKL